MRSSILLGVTCLAVITVSGLAAPFDRCGQIKSTPYCDHFAPLFPTGPWYRIELPSMPDTATLTVYHVVGETIPSDVECNPSYNDSCIVNCSVSVRPSADLGCGVLSRVYDPRIGYLCFIWSSPVYGSLITHSHGFVAGDTIHVVGIADRTGVTGPCDVAEGYLWNEVFTACPDSGSATQETTWGKLKFLFRR